MKKIRFLSIMMLAAMAMPVFIACGGDSNSGGSSTPNNPSQDAFIPFKDNRVDALCVFNFDSNGDYELSYSEAAAVADIGKVFIESNISTFDELQYFVGLKKIADFAFSNCANLRSIIIPNNVTKIGQYAFRGCSALTSINIPSGVTSLGECAFMGCTSFRSINIPNSVTDIGTGVFWNCSGLTSVNIPTSWTSTGKNTFAGCSGLTSITIPSNITEISSSAFAGCTGLTNITIPNSVTTIDQSAFSSCSALTSVVIGKNVRYIGFWGFSECTNLRNIYCYAEQPPTLYQNYSFYQTNISNITLHVPSSSVDIYKNNYYWKNFGRIVALTNSDPKP